MAGNWSGSDLPSSIPQHQFPQSELTQYLGTESRCKRSCLSGESAAKVGGAAIGGAVGAGAGTAAAMTNDRNPATLTAGTTVTVRMQAPVTVTVQKDIVGQERRWGQGRFPDAHRNSSRVCEIPTPTSRNAARGFCGDAAPLLVSGVHVSNPSTSVSVRTS